MSGNTGNYFMENILKITESKYKDNREYEAFSKDYIKEELKKDRLQVIVGFKEIFSSEIEKYGDVIKKFHNTDSVLLGTKENLLDAILNLTSVRFIELDHPVNLIIPVKTEENHEVQSDSNEWNMKMIGAPYAWEKDVTGKGVKLGIIDTGIDYDHHCLHNNFRGGYNFVENSDDPFDDHGHGTHCSGIAGAHGSDDKKLIGVAPGTDLYGLKVLSASGGGRTSDIIAAIDWAIDKGLQILSMSLGSRFPSSAMHEALTAAHERGLILVAAAGNEIIGPSFPAFYSETVSVGAVDKHKKPANFTNRDPMVDIAAPGVQVYSTIPGGKFAAYSGTSMACPHVSGVFASVLEARSMKNIEAENLLFDTAEDIKRHSWEVGRGLVRLDSALRRL